MSKTQFYPEVNPQQISKQPLTFNTICNLCSLGCTLQLLFENGKISEITGTEGLINPNAEYCTIPEKAYKELNKKERITMPLLKQGNQHVSISWDEAFALLNSRITQGAPDKKAFFAGARLTNEEQFLIMKLSRAVANTNDIGSFHYLGRGTGYTKLSRANIPFAELVESKKVYIIGAEVSKDNPVGWDFIYGNKQEHAIPIITVTTFENSDLIGNSDIALVIKSYFHFVKAANHFIVANSLEDHQYIKNLVDNFQEYKNELLSCNYSQLCNEAGVSESELENFVKAFVNEPHAVLVFSEKELSGHACGEIFNLAMLTGKHGRTGAGLLLLKENNNSHGLHDMGVMWNLGPGATPWDDPFQRSTVEFTWRSKELPTKRPFTYNTLKERGYESLFIFGEDPVGCALNKDSISSLLTGTDFIMVQDYYLTETARLANLIIPASLPFETGGTFTNSQRVIQKVSKRANSPLEYDSWKQLEELLARNGFDRYETVDDITFEVASLLPKFCTSSKLLFRINQEDNFNPLFRAGCDALLNFSV